MLDYEVTIMVRKKHALNNEQISQMAIELRLKLQELGIDLSKQKALSRLPVDMTDVYCICANYMDLINAFLTTPKRAQPKDFLKIVFEIEQHLYDHLSYHYKPLRRELKKLTKVIEPDEEKREEFLLNYLDELVIKAEKPKTNQIKKRRKTISKA